MAVIGLGWGTNQHRKMKKITYIALALFAASFCLPAYGGYESGMSGWSCFSFCFGMLVNGSETDWARLYYGGFVVTNLFAVLGLVKPHLTRITRWLSLILLLHVSSWWVINVNGDDSFFHNSIRYGYTVWLASFGLLTVVLFAAERSGVTNESSIVNKQIVAPWFPAKTVGYGWGMPRCWQGQVVVFLYLGLLIVGALVFLRDPANAGYFFLYMLGLSLVLIFICWWKGECPNQKTETKE
jgi:hypothetical protein